MQQKRFLSLRLKTFLDENTTPNNKDPVSLFVECAVACLGVEEVGGDNRGPMVEAFQATIGGRWKDDGTYDEKAAVAAESWCLSFLQAIMAYVEDRLGVVSNIPLTELVATLWSLTPAEHRKPPGTDPVRGDLVLWRYGSTMKGHCGVVIRNGRETPRVIETIEGNTSAPASMKVVDRNGNGVYQKVRAKMGTPQCQLVGFITLSFSPIPF